VGELTASVTPDPEGGEGAYKVSGTVRDVNGGPILGASVQAFISYVLTHMVCCVKTGFCTLSKKDGSYSQRVCLQKDVKRESIQVYVAGAHPLVEADTFIIRGGAEE